MGCSILLGTQSAKQLRRSQKNHELVKIQAAVLSLYSSRTWVVVIHPLISELSKQNEETKQEVFLTTKKAQYVCKRNAKYF